MTAYIMRTPLLIMRETTNKRETTHSKNITSFCQTVQLRFVSVLDSITCFT